MRRVVLIAALALVGAAGLPGVPGGARVADAHPLDLGYLRVEAHGEEVAVRLELDVDAAAAALGGAAGALDAAAVAARADELAAATYARAPIADDAGPCRWAAARAALRGRTVEVAGAATCAGRGPRRWPLPLVADAVVSPRFQLMVKETSGGAERLTLLEHGAAPLALAAAGGPAAPGDEHGARAPGLAGFVWSGFEHIGAAPGQWRAPDGGLRLPDGIDHILFLLALMLGGGSLLRRVGIATGFTLGHSITLALAALDVVRPPAAIVEPLIALTIALAALESFGGRLAAHRWKLATGFGLVHGFGFAAALAHLDLTTRGKAAALFGYNLGVELGQVAVILAAAPLLVLVHRGGRAGELARRAAGVAIFACGVFWFVQRALG